MLKPLSQCIEIKLQRLLANTGDMALKRRVRRIIEELNPREGEKILDVGCGDGYYLYLLSNLGIKLDLSGVDSDPNALRSARRNLKGKQIPLIQADLMKNLPFTNGSFDKIVMSEVVEHLPDDVKGLKEVRRVLKPGGILVLTVPNANYPFLWDPVNWTLEHLFGTHVKSGFWAGIWNQHLRLYKPEEIMNVVSRSGFEVDKIEILTWWCLPFNHNILHFGARILYGGSLSPRLSKSLSKYQTEVIEKPFLIELGFSFAGLVDKLNNLWQPKENGVGVFIKATKI